MMLKVKVTMLLFNRESNIAKIKHFLVSFMKRKKKGSHKMSADTMAWEIGQNISIWPADFQQTVS